MLPPMTEREKRILYFLRMWQYERGYSPSTSEIGEMFGVHKQTILEAVRRLVKKGYIEMSDHKHFNHRVVKFPKGTIFPWGNDALPDELFDHMHEPPVN